MENQSFKNAQPMKTKFLFLLTLTLMSMAGLVGSDVYLPTIPQIGIALGTTSKMMQLTFGFIS